MHAAEVAADAHGLQDDAACGARAPFRHWPPRPASRPWPSLADAAGSRPVSRSLHRLRRSPGKAITRLRSGRMPCGRNHRNSTISSPIATHCSDGSRFGGRLGLAFEMSRVDLLEPDRDEDRAEHGAEVIAARRR